MQLSLHVGTTPYSVILSDNSIYDSEGNELEGCAVEGRRLIVLSRIVEPQRREEIAQHEFYHCWLFHVPSPANEEQAAQLHSTVARQFQHDLEKAGGPDVLLNLRPTRVRLGKPLPTTADRTRGGREIFGSSDRMSCGGCEADVMAGSIHTGPVTAEVETTRFYVERWMQCDACGAVQVWCELSTSEGKPLGEFCAVPRPRILRGADASAWIAERSELVG